MSEELTKEFLDEYFLFLEKNYLEEVGGFFGNNTWDDGWDWETDSEIQGWTRDLSKQYNIVDYPKGDKQELEGDIDEKYKLFLTHEFCNQTTNGGYTGDEYAGELYYPLPNGKYMEISYDC